jgi:hypothetical protein
LLDSPAGTIFHPDAGCTKAPGEREEQMILVRDIFQVKFGKMKEAKEIWKEMLKLFPADARGRTRILTDLTGQYYTLVMESSYKNLTDYEAESQRDMSAQGMGALYQKFIPLVDSGKREIFTIVE